VAAVEVRRADCTHMRSNGVAVAAMCGSGCMGVEVAAIAQGRVVGAGFLVDFAMILCRLCGGLFHSPCACGANRNFAEHVGLVLRLRIASDCPSRAVAVTEA